MNASHLVHNILATLEAGLVDFFYRVNGLVDTQTLPPVGINFVIQNSGSFVQHSVRASFLSKRWCSLTTGLLGSAIVVE